MKDYNYYVSKYGDKIDNILIELEFEGLDEQQIGWECTEIFEETCNAEEIVGYYLVNEGTNSLNAWLKNIEGIDLTEQDKEVTRLLKELDKNNYR